MKDMTSRKRIVEALQHRKTDVLPIDFGGMRSTGINALAYIKLKEHLGFKNIRPKIYDIFQQLAEPEDEVIERLGGDVVQVHRLAPAFGIKIDSWKPGRLQDGSECLFPETYNPVVNSSGDFEIRQEDTVIARMPVNGLYFDQVYHPYENVQSENDIDKIFSSGMTSGHRRLPRFLL